MQIGLKGLKNDKKKDIKEIINRVKDKYPELTVLETVFYPKDGTWNDYISFIYTLSKDKNEIAEMRNDLKEDNENIPIGAEAFYPHNKDETTVESIVKKWVDYIKWAEEQAEMEEKEVAYTDIDGKIINIGDTIRLLNLRLKNKITFLRTNDVDEDDTDLILEAIVKEKIPVGVVGVGLDHIIVAGIFGGEFGGYEGDEQLFVMRINYKTSCLIVGHGDDSKHGDVFFNLNSYFYIFEDEEFVYLCTWWSGEWKTNISLYHKVKKKDYYTSERIFGAITTCSSTSMSEGFQKGNPEIFEEETFIKNGFKKSEVKILDLNERDYMKSNKAIS